MRPKATGGLPFRVAAWNAHNGNVIPFLSRVHGDPLIVLNEVKRRRRQVKSWAEGNGYRLFQERPRRDRGGVISEHGSTAVLVRDDVEVLRARVRVSPIRWIVARYRRTHEPRRDWLLRLRHRGQVYRVFVSHVPTNGPDGPSGKAVRHWIRRVRRALRARRPGVVTIDVGDHNNSVSRLRKLFPGAVVKGRGPDSVIVAGAYARRQVLGRFMSDHHAMRYAIWPKRAWRRRKNR